jgi:hypothetical protein
VAGLKFFNFSVRIFIAIGRNYGIMPVALLGRLLAENLVSSLPVPTVREGLSAAGSLKPDVGDRDVSF